MNLQKAKIYHDGSHFIAIPKGAFPSGKGCKRRVTKSTEQQPPTDKSPPETPKERFEKAYKESQSLPKRERKAHIKESLAADFPNKNELNAFVAKHTERMKTNAIKRRSRLMRKLNLQTWDYFVTFTYSDELLDEETFRKKLTNIQNTLSQGKVGSMSAYGSEVAIPTDCIFTEYFIYLTAI